MFAQIGREFIVEDVESSYVRAPKKVLPSRGAVADDERRRRGLMAVSTPKEGLVTVGSKARKSEAKPTAVEVAAGGTGRGRGRKPVSGLTV